MINGLVQDPDPAMQALAIVPGDWDRIHDAFCVFCGAHPDNRSDMLDRELHGEVSSALDCGLSAHGKLSLLVISMRLSPSVPTRQTKGSAWSARSSPISRQRRLELSRKIHLLT